MICLHFTLLVYALFLRMQHLPFFIPKRRVGASWEVGNVYNMPRTAVQETLELVNIVPIVDFIAGLCSNTFDTIIKDPEQRLNRLIQFSGPSRYALRCNRCFIVPKCKTEHFRNSFIVRSCIDNIYVHRFFVLLSYFLIQSNLLYFGH